MTQNPDFAKHDPSQPVRSFSLEFDTDHGMTATDAVYYRISIAVMIGSDLRPGVPYTVKVEPAVDEPQPYGPRIGRRTMRSTMALVALTNHADAEIGEWAIFRGKAAPPYPETLVTVPGKDPRYFAHPTDVSGYVVYQRISLEDYIALGGKAYTPTTTKEDEAAAMRA